MRVVIYGRVSSSEQREQETIESQLEACRSYCEQHDYEVVREYRDEGISGTIRLGERPAGRALITDAERGAFKAVVIFRLDRLGREVESAIAAHSQLRSLGAPVLSVQETFDDGPTGVLMFHIVVSFAQYERSVVAARMSGGRNRKAREGHALAVGTLPGWLLWDGTTVVLVEDEARRITGMLAAFGRDGIGGDRLGAELDMHPRSVYNVLTSPTVAGLRIVTPTRVDDHSKAQQQRQRRSTIREIASQPTIKEAEALATERGLIVQHVPSLITWERFHEIQQRIAVMGARTRGRTPRERLPLQGRVFCGQHDLAYTPERGRAGHIYSFCVAKKGHMAKAHGGCEMPRLPWLTDGPRSRALVGLVREALARALETPDSIQKAAADHLAALASRVDQLAAGADDAEAELKKVQARKTRLALLWSDGDVPDEAWKVQKGRLDRQIAEIEERLRQDDAAELVRLRKSFKDAKRMLSEEPFFSPLMIHDDEHLQRTADKIDLRVFVEADRLRLEAALPLGEDASIPIAVDRVRSSATPSCRPSVW